MKNIEITVSTQKNPETGRIHFVLRVVADLIFQEEKVSNVGFYQEFDALETGKLDAGKYLFDHYHELIKSKEAVYQILIHKNT